MLVDRILVRYGELTLKGRNKKDFIARLIGILKFKCRGLNLNYEKTHDRFYIILNGEDHNEVINRLDMVFGIHSYSLVTRCENDIEEIKNTSLEVVKHDLGNRNVTFKVDTKRALKSFPMQSMEITKAAASHVLINTENIKVDVRNPEVTLKIEVRQNGTFIYTSVIKGLGGFPVGVGGKGLLMLSGGIDSPVAGYLTLKRGVNVECIHFESPPYTSLGAKQKVLDLAEKLARYSHDSITRVHVIQFTKLQKAIYEHIPKSYTMTIMRRMMYRISEGLANKINALILTNGESIGQVASQTLHSMVSINSVTNMPIIRPLATMDKIEIMKTAREIDTYEISIKPYEDCCTIFVPDHPATKPNTEKCELFEKNFDYDTLINECLDNFETFEVEYGKGINVLEKETCEIDNLF